jgi:hypothetical protein
VDPIICPQGFYCILITSITDASDGVPLKCPKGTYGYTVGLTEEADCKACPDAYYCSQPGLEAPDGLCDPGYFCSHDSSSTVGASVSAPTDAVTGDICPAGGYCEMGTTVQKSCPPGSYNPDTGGMDEEACVPCLPGKYCSGENLSEPSGDCLAGYYCPIGSKTDQEYPATPGHFTLGGAEEEEECEHQYYNIYYAQDQCEECPAGFLCNGPHNDGENVGYPLTTFEDCPVGNYCEQKSSETVPCPKGTFNPDKNAVSEDSCRKCLPGQYCSEVGLDTPGDGDIASDPNCLGGYYCLESSQTPNPDTVDGDSNRWGPCEEGYYCPLGSSFQIPCPPGTFNPDVKQSSVSACGSCTQGYYCGTSGLSEEEGLCNEGFYCEAGSKTGRPSTAYCDVGEYCPEGAYSTTPCPAGTYQDNTHQGSCKDCPIGHYCEQETSDFTANPCPVGHYCPLKTTTANEFPCPIGTYNPDERRYVISHCIYCTPGKYCSTTGRSTVEGDCDEGYYCRLGAASETPPSTTGGPTGQGSKCTIGK